MYVSPLFTPSQFSVVLSALAVDRTNLCLFSAPQLSYLMFHYVTGIPFQSDLHSGAYDDLTLWEQIDQGAHYTPAKKWLFSVPIGL